MQVAKHLKQLAGESAVYGLARTSTKLVAVFLVPLYTRVFTPEDFGIIALIEVLIGLVGMFAVLGLDGAAARWYYDSDEVDDRRATIGSWFWCELAAGAAMAAGLVVFAPGVSALLCGSPEYSGLIRLSAVALPLATAGRVLGSWLRYQRRPWATIAFTTAASLATIALIVLFVLVGRQGLTGLYVAKLIAAILSTAVSVVVLRSWIAAGAFSWDRLRRMLRYGLPMVPAAVGLWVMMSADRFVLRIYCPTGEIGLYAIATMVASVVALAGAAFTQAWGPFAFSIQNQNGAPQVYARVLDFYSFLGCILCTAIALFAPLLLRLLTTEAYYAAASCVALLAFGYFFDGARYIAALGTSLAKNSVPNALSIGIGAAVNMGLNFLLIPSFGRDGAAVATMAAYACSVVYLFAASQRNYRIPYRWRAAVICPAFSWAIVGICWWLLPEVSLLDVAARAAMLLLFIPLGVSLGLIRWRHVARLFGRVLGGPEVDLSRKLSRFSAERPFTRNE